MNDVDERAAVADIEGWLVERVAFFVEMDPQDVDPSVDLVKYGIDSIRALTLSANIEDEYDLDIEASLAWDYRTVRAIAQYIATKLSDA